MEIEIKPVLSKLFLYPIKSLPGILLDSAIVSPNGLVHPNNQEVIDRKWMIVDENRSFLSQRKLPKMVLIKPKICGNFIHLSAPNKTDIKFAINHQSTKIKCRLWSINIDCYSYGINSEVSKWLSDFLGIKNLDLVSICDLESRKQAEFNSFMLLSEESLNDLNSRLENQVDVVNFRPNFVVKNACSAYSEDNWNRIKISKSYFNKTDYCIRCNMVTVDPNTGAKSQDMQPLKTLKEYRIYRSLCGLSPIFGMYFELDTINNFEPQQTVSIGESIVLNLE